MKSAACPGFRFAGVAAGIKPAPKHDLGLIAAETEVPTFAVFTRNRVRAAPVELSAARVKSGLCRAIIVNSGNANACTGERGRRDAEAMAHHAGKALGCDEKRVLVASTGVIGVPLPVERVVEATPKLVAALRPESIDEFTQAIMTTDRFEKRSLALFSLGKKTPARVFGVAKGAGMISPNCATTLVFLTTDAAVSKSYLAKALRDEIEVFNQISVDGDTSTNDSVFLMASGAAKNRPIEGSADGESLQKAIREVLSELGHQIIRDGEGALHVVTIEVLGASSVADGDRIARRIAASPLVKTAFYGADPNWGRVVCAIGNAGVEIDPARIDLAFGEVELVRDGVGLGKEAERAAHEVMRRGEYTLRVHLHQGRATARHLTCDFGVDYVKLNAAYRS